MKNIISIVIVLMISMLTYQMQAQGCDAEDPNDSIAPAKIKLFGLCSLSITIPYPTQQKALLNSEGHELVSGDVFLKTGPIILCLKQVRL